LGKVPPRGRMTFSVPSDQKVRQCESGRVSRYWILIGGKRSYPVKGQAGERKKYERVQDTYLLGLTSFGFAKTLSKHWKKKTCIKNVIALDIYHDPGRSYREIVHRKLCSKRDHGPVGVPGGEESRLL